MIGTRLKQLREEKGLKQEELAKQLSIAPSTIGMYETNKREPNNELTIKICNFFNCSVDYLMGIKDYKNEDDYMENNTEETCKAIENYEYLQKTYPNLNIEDVANRMFTAYRSNKNHLSVMDKLLQDLPLDVKERAKQTALFLYNNLLFMPNNSNIRLYSSKHLSDTPKIPILNTVKAGYDWLAKENVIGHITDKNTVKDYEKNITEYYALQVTDDSMLPLLAKGDLVIVHSQDNVENGQTAVVLIGEEEATVKKVVKTNEGIELHSMNPYYPVKKFTFEDMKTIPVKIIGRVKEAKIKGAFE